jgi:hypothetical protein
MYALGSDSYISPITQKHPCGLQAPEKRRYVPQIAHNQICSYAHIAPQYAGPGFVIEKTRKDRRREEAGAFFGIFS